MAIPGNSKNMKNKHQNAQVITSLADFRTHIINLQGKAGEQNDLQFRW